jgi:hypothetical protein
LSLCVALNRVKRTGGTIRRDCAGGQKLHVAQHGIQRSAKLVRQNREKIILQLTGPFDLQARLLLTLEEPGPFRVGLLPLVISRAIVDAPTTPPAGEWIGDTVNDTWTPLPSFRCRTVSKWSTRLPWQSCRMTSSSSLHRSSGMIVRIERPIISVALQPNIRSAP